MSTEKKTFEATPNFMFEACALIYSRWTKEFDLLKACKAEKNDGSTDWQAFHDHRLAHQTAQEAKWHKLVDEAGPLSAQASGRV